MKPLGPVELRAVLEDDARRTADESIAARRGLDLAAVAERVLSDHDWRPEVRNRREFLRKHLEDYVGEYFDRKQQSRPGAERRRHPRVELCAAVIVGEIGAAVVLPVRNISLGGVFLLADGNDLTELVAGASLDLVVFCPVRETLQVAAAAEVVRNRGHGVALKWRPDDILKIAAFVEGAQQTHSTQE